MPLIGQRNLLAIIREWDGMAQDFIKKMIDSMPKRVAKVVQVNGNAIEY
jgi:hypothetical protein